MAAEDRDAVILVMLEEQANEGPVRDRLINLQQMRNPIIWTEDPDGQRLFWERLHAALVFVHGNPIFA